MFNFVVLLLYSFLSLCCLPKLNSFIYHCRYLFKIIVPCHYYCCHYADWSEVFGILDWLGFYFNRRILVLWRNMFPNGEEISFCIKYFALRAVSLRFFPFMSWRFSCWLNPFMSLDILLVICNEGVSYELLSMIILSRIRIRLMAKDNGFIFCIIL